MQTLIETEQKRLIKKFHAMLGKAKIGTEGKEAILSSYRVESTKDLTVAQLIEACNAIDMYIKPELATLDGFRKRLIASIGGWLRAMNRTENIQIIKAIACRAAQVKTFNEIPLERLRSLYSAFNKKKKDLAMVEELTLEELNYLAIRN
ncbi:MAG: hypothetical protein LBJ72_12480 [Dysgonamonadaceae bacterium]|jgi:hypothetical protein|nr:hypothetical protein [Dysgonamonadaceae bacterium]